MSALSEAQRQDLKDRRRRSRAGSYIEQPGDWQEFENDDGIPYFYNLYVHIKPWSQPKVTPN